MLFQEAIVYTTMTKVRQALAPDGEDQANPTSNYQGTAASLGDNAIKDAIAQAQAVVDGYLGTVYTLPITQVVESPTGDLVAPGSIPYWARDIAAWYATLTFKRNQPIGATDPVQLRYNAAIVALTRIQNGQSSIPELDVTIGDGGGPSTGVAVTVNQYAGTLFTPYDVLSPTVGDPWPASQRRGTFWPW